MANLGPHAAFIIAAYCVAGAVVAALVIWVIADGRVVRRRIAALEATGVRRGGKSAP